MYKMRVGISLYGLKIPGIYENESAFINNIDKITKTTNLFELPMIPLAWIPALIEYKRYNAVEFDTIHMPKDFFGVSLAKQMLLLNQAKIIVNKLGISTIVFHPADRKIEKRIIDLVDILVKKNEQISFELCNMNLLKYQHDYLENPHHKLLIDFAHLMRMNMQVDGMDLCRVSHIHIRGYNKKLRYARVIDSLDKIQEFLCFFKNSGIYKNLMLEYPYENIEDIETDYKLLQSII